MSTSPIPSLAADHLCIGVADMDRAIDWYGRALGFALERRWTIPQLPGCELAYVSGANGFRLELIAGGPELSSSTTATFPERLSARGMSHLCFRVDAVDAALAAVQRVGTKVLFPPTDLADTAQKRVAIFEDMDGNLIEFAGPLSGAGK